LWFFRVYKITWRYVGLYDMIHIVTAMFVAGCVLIILSLPNLPIPALEITNFPKRVIFADSVISLFLISGLRIAKRLYMEVFREKGMSRKGKRTLIIGAGNAGEMILRDMARQGYDLYRPVAILDDDPMKVGTYLRNLKVLGKTALLSDVLVEERIEAIIIAIPSLDHKALRILYEASRKSQVLDIKVIPRIYNFNKPELNVKGLEDISIEDLIGRQSVVVDSSALESFIAGKAVLITGAGGSIGAEIVIQVCAFQPDRLIVFDSDETELHNLGLRLQRRFPHLADRVIYANGDIRDRGRVEEIFRELAPQIVFHAAALKHVPLMEFNPKEAVKVNVFGTYELAKAAVLNGIDKFVMISTDKAVRPTSVMGATKRVAEYVCQAMNGAGGQTQFVSVRFGNVLGSRGSVLPTFLDQLRHGEALTVTHPDMKRYFMTIPEAVTLVLQAAVIGRGGEVMVLDMGEPVKITDFAEELIRIHGLEPYKDVDINFMGLRPGEKLFEEILTAEEGTDATCHEKIFTARNASGCNRAEIEAILAEFQDVLQEPSLQNDSKIRDLLNKYVKHYKEE
jgi:FlaA1/EpsC-like NDP-sugar epimerase